MVQVCCGEQNIQDDPLCLEDDEIQSFLGIARQRILQQGVSVQDVQLSMGHTDVASTMRYMATMRKEYLRQKVNAVKFPVSFVL